MRFTKLATGLLFSAALLVPAGAVLAGGPSPPILQGFFIFEDASEAGSNCSFFDFDFADFGLDGFVSGVASTGETVTVDYNALFIDRVQVKSDKGAQSARERSDISISIDDGVAVNTFSGNPDKCRVQGKMKDPSSGSDEARVSVTCEVGVDGANLTPVPAAADVTIVQDAFSARKDVGLKGKNLKIKQKGVDGTGGPC